MDTITERIQRARVKLMNYILKGDKGMVEEYKHYIKNLEAELAAEENEPIIAEVEMQYGDDSPLFAEV